MSTRTAYLLLAGAMLLPACSPGLGDFCFEDSDCKPGLRCSGTGGKRGVCTYPEGVPDLAARPDRIRDISPPDQRLEAAPDHGLETAPDQGVDLAPDLAADQGPPDLPPADLPPPDLPPMDLPGLDL